MTTEKDNRYKIVINVFSAIAFIALLLFVFIKMGNSTLNDVVENIMFLIFITPILGGIALVSTAEITGGINWSTKKATDGYFVAFGLYIILIGTTMLYYVNAHPSTAFGMISVLLAIIIFVSVFLKMKEIRKPRAEKPTTDTPDEIPICSGCDSQMSEEELYSKGDSPDVGYDYYKCENCGEKTSKDAALTASGDRYILDFFYEK